MSEGMAQTQRHLILGTAGHVDHGKTELVRALTGLDTDRLKEEKERGISIELGFAPLVLDDHTFLGVVDVPGHERFVKQMVSGAGGIDMALLLIAADEGVMPQTQEHMEVLNSLRIEHGVVVISKIDLGDDDTLLLLEDEIAELTAGTFLESAPVIATSARTGVGLDALKIALRKIADEIPPRPRSGPFRLAVDRVFHQKGIGVVTTGSCYSGTISSGDALELLPSGHKVRVRELQSFGKKRASGSAGERLAVALQGVKLADVSRGDMLCTRSVYTATEAIDLRLRLGHYDRFEVKNRERIRVHHGAREVLGRVILLEADTLASGDNSLVQIKLEAPIVAATGDDVVIRKYSPARVLGGGAIIDPNPPRHKRMDAAVLERLRIKEQGDPVEILCKAVEVAGGVGVPVEEAGGALEEAVTSGDVVVIGESLFHRETIATLVAALIRLVTQHTTEHPLSWGLDKEELRQRLGFSHGAHVFNRFLEIIVSSQPVFVRGARVRVGTEKLSLDDGQKKSIAALADTVRSAGARFLTRKQLEEQWRGGEDFHDVLQYMLETEQIVELGDDGVMAIEVMDQCARSLVALLNEKEEIAVTDLKDVLGLSRKHVVPLLEYFDMKRLTRRDGNVRRKGSAFSPIVDNLNSP